MPYQTLHQAAPALQERSAPHAADIAAAEFERNNRLFALCAAAAMVSAIGAAVGLSLL